jgi:IclR family KDG regulon transcriptional repressor
MKEQNVQTLDRTLDIIELLATKPKGLGVTEIGQLLSLHKSTVHRLINALAQRGYISKEPKSGIYKIGLKFIEISSLFFHQIELKTEALPYMRHLAEQTGQTVHLAILDGDDVVYIEKVDALQSLRMYSQIGKRIPVYCSGLGKVLLSGLSPGNRQEIIFKNNLVKYTPNTILDRDILLKQIDDVIKLGWALDDEEHEEGIRCIAVPIYDFTGKIIAALSISGDKQILSPGQDSYNSGLILVTAGEISKRLGYIRNSVD